MKKTIKIDDVTINYTLSMSENEDFSLQISTNQSKEYLSNHKNPIINNIGEIIEKFDNNLKRNVILPDNLIILLRNDFLKGMSFYTAYIETVQYNPILERLINPIEKYSEVQYNETEENDKNYIISTKDGQYYIEIFIQNSTLEEEETINQEEELKEKLKKALREEKYELAAEYKKLLTELKNKNK